MEEEEEEWGSRRETERGGYWVRGVVRCGTGLVWKGGVPGTQGGGWWLGVWVPREGSAGCGPGRKGRVVTVAKVMVRTRGWRGTMVHSM